MFPHRTPSVNAPTILLYFIGWVSNSQSIRIKEVLERDGVQTSLAVCMWNLRRRSWTYLC